MCPKTVTKTTPETQPPKYHQKASKITKSGAQMRSQKFDFFLNFWTIVTPGSPKGAPRAPQVRPKSPQDPILPPKGTQGTILEPQGRPQSPKGSPKGTPRAQFCLFLGPLGTLLRPSLHFINFAPQKWHPRVDFPRCL